jgi:hypothetical protein
MAVLHKKEEKIQAVLGRLPKKYTQEEFVALFIKLYSKDWGKIKSAYIKQAQDKEPGTVINMPKPDLYLKQVLEIYLKQNAIVEPVEEKIVKAKKETVAVTKAVKAPTKKIKVAEPESSTIKKSAEKVPKAPVKAKTAKKEK